MLAWGGFHVFEPCHPEVEEHIRLPDMIDTVGRNCVSCAFILGLVCCSPPSGVPLVRELTHARRWTSAPTRTGFLAIRKLTSCHSLELILKPDQSSPS